MATSLVPQTSDAHQDPIGEIGPRVRVEADRFVLTFRHVERLPPPTRKRPPVEETCLRVVYGPDGTVLTPRTVEPGACVRDRGDLRSAGGVALRRGSDGRVSFPSPFVVHGGRPWVQFLTGDEVGPRHFPAWGSLRINLVHDAVTAGGDLVVLATQLRPGARGGLPSSGDDVEFVLFRFDQQSSLAKLRLDAPRTIYTYPIVSDIAVVAHHEYAVAFLTAGTTMQVTTWSSERGKSKTAKIADRVHWNSKVAMATIGRRALVAYHSCDREGVPSTVKVQALTLPVP